MLFPQPNLEQNKIIIKPLVGMAVVGFQEVVLLLWIHCLMFSCSHFELGYFGISPCFVV